MFGLGGDKNKTFKPKKKIAKGSKMDELHRMARATLGISQNLRSAVKLPAGEDLNEWLAVHVRPCSVPHWPVADALDDRLLQPDQSAVR